MKKNTSNNMSRSWLIRGAQSVALLLTACVLLLGAWTTQAQPTDPPATPTVPSGQVDAVYNSSGTYANLTVAFESWCAGTLSTYTILPSGPVVWYANISCAQGIGFEATPQNITPYTYLHIDLYVTSGNSLAVRLVSQVGGQADYTFTSAGGQIAPLNTWLHLDIPISAFHAANPGMDLTKIQQIGLVQNNPGTSAATYYIDNVYFYYPPPTPVSVAITSPANGASVGNNSFTITASAIVYPGAVTNVNYYDSTTLLGNATNSPFSYVATGVTPLGAHTLTAIAYANDGTKATNSVNITVTNNPVIAYEPFNYTSGQITVNTAPPSGFTGNWSGGVLGINNYGLSYPGLPVANNSASNIGANNMWTHIANAPISGSVWVSFLYKQGADNGGFRAGIILENSAGTGIMLSQHQVSGTQGYPCLMAMTGTTGVGAEIGTSANLQTYLNTNLYVMQFHYSAGVVSSVDVYVNPTAGQSTAPSPDFTVSSGLPSFGALVNFGLFEAPGVAAITTDEWRVGTTFGSVVGGPSTVASVPTTLALSVAVGKQVSWTANATDSYQPQKSSDNVNWSNQGGVLAGNTVTSVYDSTPSAYYQVLDYTVGPLVNVVNNGDFEISDSGFTGNAQLWNGFAGLGSFAELVNGSLTFNGTNTINPHSGSNWFQIDNTTTPSNAGVYQNNISVTPGAPYTLSFYAANPVKGISGDPQYQIIWYDGINPGAISVVTGHFGSAGGATGTNWTLVSANLTAPANAAVMTVQFLVAIGAVSGDTWASAIDDVQVTTPSAGPTNILTATVQSGAIFTAIVQTNGVTAGDASGTVLFKTNTVSQSSGGVSAGSANSTPAVVPASYTLTAIYSGDGTYLGSTGTLVVGGSNFGPNPGTVSLTGGNATVVMSGTAGNNYSLQRATNVTFTAGISNFPTIMAPVGGNVTNVDNFSDLGLVPAEAFYRLHYIP